MILNPAKGFTLIELLVVISIIGVLSTIAMTSLSAARMKARDMKRISELEQLKNALEVYYSEFGKYPDNTDTTLDARCWGSWDAGTVLDSGDTFLQPLVTAGIVTSVPIETNPISKDIAGASREYICSYRYVKQTSAVCGCTERYAVLYTSLETAAAPTDERPSCIKSCWGEGGSARDYTIYLPY